MSTDTTAIDAIVCRRLRAALEAMRLHWVHNGFPTTSESVFAALATLPPSAAECAGYVCAGYENEEGGRTSHVYPWTLCAENECSCECGLPFSAHAAPAAQAAATLPRCEHGAPAWACKAAASAPPAVPPMPVATAWIHDGRIEYILPREDRRTGHAYPNGQQSMVFASDATAPPRLRDRRA